MLDMVLNSIQLFFKGKLFQDPRQVIRDILIGAGVTATVLIVLSLADLPLWASAGIAGLAGGTLQPWLFRHLKYA